MSNPTEEENDVMSDEDLQAEASDVSKDTPATDGGQPGKEGSEAKPEHQPKPGPDAGAGGPPSTIPYERFAEVNRRARAAEQEISRLRQGGDQRQQQQEPQGPQMPKEEDFPGDFQGFLDARAAHIADMRYEHRRTQEAQANRQMQHQSRAQSASDNWQQKTAAMPADFHDAAQSLRLPGDLWMHVMESDDPAKLADHLMKNPAEAQKFFTMSADRAYRELGRMEMRLTGQQAAPNKKPASQVPDLDPAGKGNKPGGRDPLSTDATDAEFIAAMFPRAG